MTTVGNRKGFKFTKISNTTAVTETLAFDEIEKESTIQPIVGSKRLRSKVAAVNSNDAINESNKTSPSSNSSKNNQSVSPTKSTKSKSSKDEIIRLNEEISAKSQVKESLEKSINEEDNQESKKTYYPTIPYNPSGKLRSKSNKNHIELLKHLIAEVCTAESDGLKNFFQSSFKGKNRKAIEPILLDILSQIPTAVMDECSDDLTFQPEFSQIEKQRIDKLSSMQQKLEEYHELLLRYENDINLFAKDFDLWIADVPQKSSSKNFQLSESTLNTINQYDALLESMGKHSSIILEESEAIVKEIDIAKKKQEMLYSTCKEMKSDDVDTKNVIKRFR